MRRLGAMAGGRLTIASGPATQRFGSLVRGDREPIDAAITVHDERFYGRALLGSDIGIGESFMDGDWTTPDLVALARLMIRNIPLLDAHGGPGPRIARSMAAAARRLRDNSIAGSRRHIAEHYDLGNDFFRLFLDESLLYSSAYYQTGRESLEQAQQQKLDAICRKLSLQPGDHVLEIGTGWGAFAVWAATRYGCRVTTTTISREQYRHAREWTSRLGEAGRRIEVLLADYRHLTGRFDRIVSIEMFEAVGLNRYDEFFAATDRLLRPDGAMLIQTITMDEQRFRRYHGSADWIEKHIFPGGELASVAEILRSLQRVTALSLYHAESFGTHYARTLREWRARYLRRLDEVRSLGFDDRFIRKWDFYLALCEAAFLERHTGVVQIVLNKNYSPALLFNEPWSGTSAAAVA